MQSNDLQAELDRLQSLIDLIHGEIEQRKKEPTLKEFARWLSSDPDWGEDKSTAQTAKSVDKVICAFLCQNS